MYRLEGEKQRIELSDRGGVRAIIDKRSMRNYISPRPQGEHPLFRIGCLEYGENGMQPGELVYTSRLVMPAAAVEGEEIRLRYERLDDLDLTVNCRIWMDSRDGLCHFRIDIENRTSMGISFVEFPVIECPAMLGKEPSDNYIVLPKQDGYLLPSPLFQRWEGDSPERSHDQRFQYPGAGREFPENLSAQFLAFYDHDGGLYLGAHDGKGNPKKMGPVWLEEEGADRVALTPYLQGSPQAGGSFHTEYDLTAGCFEGDWQAAADLYKAFGVKQDWCRLTVEQRKDIPEWIKKGAVFFNIRLRGQQCSRYLEKLPDYLQDWQEFFGIPLVAMMCGWEKLGEWMGPDYFPPYGGKDAFVKMIERIKEKGMIPFPFGLSGFKLPIRKKIPGDWSQPELAVDYDNRKAFAETLCDDAATDVLGHYITDSPVNSWDGYHAYACVATKQARKQMYEASLILAREYGVLLVQADQVFGGGVTECYNPAHGHPIGRGTWQVEALRRMYDDIRREGKETDKEFALSQEFMSELFIQHLDLYHARLFDEPRGLRGIPLFSYLYHEYIPCYGGDWSSQLADNTCGVYNHAANFVYGALPAACPQSMRGSMKNELMNECDAAILKMGKNTCRLFVQFPQYFLQGRMLHTEKLEIPDIKVLYTGVNFSGWKKGQGTQPAVLHCRWEAPDGNRAVALANISPQIQEVRLPVTYESGTAILWINGEQPKQLRIRRHMAVFRMEPQDAGVLEECSCGVRRPTAEKSGAFYQLHPLPGIPSEKE